MKRDLDQRIKDALPEVGREHEPDPDWQRGVWERIQAEQAAWEADRRDRARPWYRRHVTLIWTAVAVLAAVTLAIALTGCAVSSATATAGAGPSVDAGAPADAPTLDAPTPDAPPTTWVQRLYDVTTGPVNPESPAWGWQPAGPSFNGPLTASPDFRGFVINTLGRPVPTREAVGHPLTPRTSYALQVNLSAADGTAYYLPIGQRVQVADPTMPLGYRWESGFTIQAGTSRGDALVIAGGDQVGGDAWIGWADGSAGISVADYAASILNTIEIRVDAYGNAEATVGGRTLRRSGFHVGTQVVIGDASDEVGADAALVFSLIVQYEPPGGVVLQ